MIIPLSAERLRSVRLHSGDCAQRVYCSCHKAGFFRRLNDVRIRHDILSREEVVSEKSLLTVDRQIGLGLEHCSPR